MCACVYAYMHAWKKQELLAQSEAHIHTYIHTYIQALKEHELLAKSEASAMREEVDKLTEMLREATEKLKVSPQLCAFVCVCICVCLHLCVCVCV